MCRGYGITLHPSPVKPRPVTWEGALAYCQESACAGLRGQALDAGHPARLSSAARAGLHTEAVCEAPGCTDRASSKETENMKQNKELGDKGVYVPKEGLSPLPTEQPEKPAVQSASETEGAGAVPKGCADRPENQALLDDVCDAFSAALGVNMSAEGAIAAAEHLAELDRAELLASLSWLRAWVEREALPGSAPACLWSALRAAVRSAGITEIGETESWDHVGPGSTLLDVATDVLGIVDPHGSSYSDRRAWLHTLGDGALREVIAWGRKVHEGPSAAPQCLRDRLPQGHWLRSWSMGPSAPLAEDAGLAEAVAWVRPRTEAEPHPWAAARERMGALPEVAEYLSEAARVLDAAYLLASRHPLGGPEGEPRAWLAEAHACVTRAAELSRAAADVALRRRVTVVDAVGDAIIAGGCAYLDGQWWSLRTGEAVSGGRRVVLSRAERLSNEVIASLLRSGT